MLQSSLRELEEAIRGAWCVWTSDPVDQPGWSESNPASGQCASTALVVQDLLGGELLVADVKGDGGAPQGVHYWNRLAGGIELDLTREQFQDCLARELREETGLEVAVDRVVGVVGLEVVPGRWVDVVGYGCLMPGGPLAAVSVSHEHVCVGFRDPATLSDDELPLAYRQLIAQLRS